MRRRIICDRSPEKCQKCAKKGLECPGYGIRYRFATEKVPVALHRAVARAPCSETGADLPSPSPARNTPSLQWIDGLKKNSRKIKLKNNSIKNRIDQKLHVDLEQKDKRVEGASRCVPQDTTTELISTSVPAISNVTDEISSMISNNLFQLHLGLISVIPPSLPEHIDSKTRFLFKHFCDFVSPVMVYIDGRSNGYRYEVLPFAYQDPLVQRAVCVTAAFHLAPKYPEFLSPAEGGRTAIIRKLCQMAQFSDDSVLSNSTWATILLLMVGDLVTGHEDIMILYRMLVHLTSAWRQKTYPRSTLEEFMDYQSRLFEFFALPVAEESATVQSLQLICNDPLSSFEIYAPNREVDINSLDLASHITLTLVDRAFRLATKIYLGRAQCSVGTTSANKITPGFMSTDTWTVDMCREDLLVEMRHLLEAVPPGATGAHVLVWPIFVAALESGGSELGEFFVGKLRFIWETTGYANVKKAMEALPEIWRRSRSERWTLCLPSVSTVVM